MRTVLTANFIKTATAEPGKERSVYWDATMPSFGLVVTSSGARSFVYQYRAHGVSRRLTLDGKLALDAARRLAKKRMGEVADGRDPVVERRKQAAVSRAAASGTLEFIAREFFKREGPKIRTMEERRRTFERLVFPKLGAQPIGDIRRIDIVRLLDQIEDKRGATMADNTLAHLSRLFNWYASRTDDFRSPVVRGMRRTKPAERARTRVLTDAEIAAVWKAADEKLGPFGSYIKFLLLTATRRTEAARAAWHEIDSHNDWTIPARRSKTKIDIVLPLSKAAHAVLEVPRQFGKGAFVFSYDGAHPIRGFGKPKDKLDKLSGVTDWTLHDLRRTARTLLSRAGVSSDIAERCLGHVIPGVRATYDRHRYRDEMLAAFEKLANQIERIVNPQQNVVAMARK
jgi:integrase